MLSFDCETRSLQIIIYNIVINKEDGRFNGGSFIGVAQYFYNYSDHGNLAEEKFDLILNNIGGNKGASRDM